MKIRFSYYLLMASLPFITFKISGVPVTYLVGVFFVFQYVIVCRNIVFENDIFLLSIGYVFISLVSYFYSLYPGETFVWAQKVVFWHVLFVLLISGGRYLDYRSINVAFLIFVWAVVLVVLVGFLSSGSIFDRLRSQFLNEPNELALYCLFAFYLLRFVDLNKLVKRGVGAFLMFSVLASQSKTVIMLTVLYFAYFEMVSKRPIEDKIFRLILLLLIVWVVAYLMLLIRPISSGQEFNIADFSSGRTSLILIGFEIIKDNWLFGVGGGGFVEASKEFKFDFVLNTMWENQGISGAAHNTYLEILVGVGMLGLMVHFLLLRAIYLRIEGSDRFVFILLLVSHFALSSEFDRILWVLVPIFIVKKHYFFDTIPHNSKRAIWRISNRAMKMGAR